MAKTNVRVVMNRRALDAWSAGIVDGMEAMGEEFNNVIQPPDAAPFGQGLIDTHDYVVLSHGRKVAGGASKPRSVRAYKDRIILVAGEGFPGRFVELGTVDTRPQPHVTPAMLQVIPDADVAIKASVRKRLARA